MWWRCKIKAERDEEEQVKMNKRYIAPLKRELREVARSMGIIRPIQMFEDSGETIENSETTRSIMDFSPPHFSPNQDMIYREWQEYKRKHGDTDDAKPQSIARFLQPY